MKLYRIQVKYKNIYIDEILGAENDKAALEYLVKKVDSGDVTEKPGAGFEDPNFLFLTFEEVDRNVSTRTSGEETSAGIQVGNTSVVSGQSNS